MARVTLYLDDETNLRVRKAAKAAGLSRSRWLAELVLKETAGEWPAEVHDLAGAWPGFPEADDLRSGSARDIRCDLL